MAIVHLAFYTLSQYYIKMYAQTYGFHLESSVRGVNGRGNHMCNVAHIIYASLARVLKRICLE